MVVAFGLFLGLVHGETLLYGGVRVVRLLTHVDES